MAQIRPVSDLRNNFAEISKVVHDSAKPVFLTKNGRGDMVVMSIETYENLEYERFVASKLKEAEIEAQTTDIRYTHEEVFSTVRKKLQNRINNSNV